MEFSLSARCQELQLQLTQFMDDHVYPAEAVYEEQMAASGDPHHHPPIMEELKGEARRRGLWNLFLPHKTEWTDGLSNADYAPLAEVMGRSPIASEVCNCSAPDTGNMEILAEHGTDDQKQHWLDPLLNDHVRSCFSMTEPNTAGSDPTGLATQAELEGDEWVINGHKWFTSGAVGASLAIAKPAPRSPSRLSAGTRQPS